MGLGMGEIFVILLVVLLVFGAKRLPEIAGQMGKAVTEFKKAKDEFLNSPTPKTDVSVAGAVTVDVKAEEVKAVPAEKAQENGQAQK